MCLSKIFFSVVFYGLFHGLFLLPVMLSFVGPAPYSSAENAALKEDTIRRHSGFGDVNHPEISKPSNGIHLDNSVYLAKNHRNGIVNENFVD